MDLDEFYYKKKKKVARSKLIQENWRRVWFDYSKKFQKLPWKITEIQQRRINISELKEKKRTKLLAEEERSEPGEGDESNEKAGSGGKDWGNKRGKTHSSHSSCGFRGSHRLQRKSQPSNPEAMQAYSSPHHESTPLFPLNQFIRPFSVVFLINL